MARSGEGGEGFDDGSGPMADPELLETIGSHLRASYRALMDEPVREHLLALIRRMGGEEDEA